MRAPTPVMPGETAAHSYAAEAARLYTQRGDEYHRLISFFPNLWAHVVEARG